MNITILGREYTIKIVPTRSPELLDNNNHNFGIHHYSTATIIIDKTLPKQTFLETLRHEIAHAVFDVCCLNKENYSEEDVCEIIGMHGAAISSLAEMVWEGLK